MPANSASKLIFAYEHFELLTLDWPEKFSTSLNFSRLQKMLHTPDVRDRKLLKRERNRWAELKCICVSLFCEYFVVDGSCEGQIELIVVVGSAVEVKFTCQYTGCFISICYFRKSHISVTGKSSRIKLVSLER